MRTLYFFSLFLLISTNALSETVVFDSDRWPTLEQNCIAKAVESIAAKDKKFPAIEVIGVRSEGGSNFTVHAQTTQSNFCSGNGYFKFSRNSENGFVCTLDRGATIFSVLRLECEGHAQKINVLPVKLGPKRIKLKFR